MPYTGDAWPESRRPWPIGWTLSIVWALLTASAFAQSDAPRLAKQDYIHAVTRGAGLAPGQQPRPSPEEEEFRAYIEDRKTALLQEAHEVERPAILAHDQLERGRKNVRETPWGEKWFQGRKTLADYLIAQPDDYIERMIPTLTPGNPYGFTCPNCVEKRTQEGAGRAKWSHHDPDVIVCAVCGQMYPSPDYPESAILQCPRSGQTFTGYLNPDEQAHPEDRTGNRAYHWVGYPIHTSFAGGIRGQKVSFMLNALSALAQTYAITDDPRYAQTGIRVLQRLAQCFRGWLYHDYWDTIADCDPLYAAWHDRELPIEWKRHLCEKAYEKDDLDAAAMLQTYWGAGRLSPSTGGISSLESVCLAYDLFYDARDDQGRPLWTPEERTRVARDLILEWIMEAEPYLGGPGKADLVHNKSPRLYRAMALVARCLGLPNFTQVALSGYEGLLAKSFFYDGFSRESPGYTQMYLSKIFELTELLHGLPDPESGRPIDLYADDPRLRMIFRALLDQLDGRGCFLPVQDTHENAHPIRPVIEIGMKRYPEYYAGLFQTLTAMAAPSDYAIFNLTNDDIAASRPFQPPEILFPEWKMAIFRHGAPDHPTTLAMPFNAYTAHCHDDNLTLYYAVGDSAMLGDQGYVGDHPADAWNRSTLSHNLVVVDDQPQIPCHETRHPHFRFAATTPVVSVIEASSDSYPQCPEYRRLIALLKGPEGRTCAVDIFRITGGAKHTYQAHSDLARNDIEGSALTFEDLGMPPESPIPDYGQSLDRACIFDIRDLREAPAPGPQWRAQWAEPGRSYRLWMLSQVDAVFAGHGPGQTNLKSGGLRTRYLQAVRTGDAPFTSTFAVLHEPSDPAGALHIREARRLPVPESAGPNALALEIVTSWGAYLFLNEFDQAAEVRSARFEGTLGIIFSAPASPRWSMTLAASTLRFGDHGFEGKPAEWRGPVWEVAEEAILAETDCPAGFPALPGRLHQLCHRPRPRMVGRASPSTASRRMPSIAAGSCRRPSPNSGCRPSPSRPSPPIDPSAISGIGPSGRPPRRPGHRTLHLPRRDRSAPPRPHPPTGIAAPPRRKAPARSKPRSASAHRPRPPDRAIRSPAALGRGFPVSAMNWVTVFSVAIVAWKGNQAPPGSPTIRMPCRLSLQSTRIRCCTPSPR